MSINLKNLRPSTLARLKALAKKRAAAGAPALSLEALAALLVSKIDG